MGNYERAYIYFDTNSLECRHSGKSLFLSQFTVNTLYYDTEQLIRAMGLTERVEICIPEIVWYELQEHLIRYFKSEKDAFEAKISSLKKSFGNLFDVSYEFRGCQTVQEYKDYLTNISQEFLDNPKVNAKIILCPKDENSIRRIIDQAIHSVKPFTKAKAGGKEYTDAGFKDALIFSTILKHTGNELGIFISNDNDFLGLFNELHTSNLKRCTSLAEVQAVLAEAFDVVSTDMAKEIIKTDKYLQQRILSECDIDEPASVSNIEILSCRAVEDDNTNITFIATVNGEKIKFEIIYNVGAKELLTASAEFAGERDEE